MKRASGAAKETEGVSCHWLLLAESAVPRGGGWLSAEERRTEAELHLEKRRRDWRLGRFAAKRLLIESGLAPVAAAGRLSIQADDDGAPEAFLDGRSLDLTLSISHAAGHGAVAAAPGRVALGCDLEKVEPRSAAFVETFFTAAERRQLAAADDPALVANLIWSAKESWLKACRCGLRRDTRTVEVAVELDAAELNGWRAFALRDVEQGLYGGGWWRPVPDAASLLTVIDGSGPPRSAFPAAGGSP